MHLNLAHFDLAHFNVFALPVLPITIATFGLAGTAFFLAGAFQRKHQLHPVAFIKYMFPWAYLKSASTKVDIFLYFAGKVSNKFYGILETFIVIAGAMAFNAFLSKHFPNHHPAKLTLTVTIGLGVLFIIIVDFANYLTHLLQHKIPFLWELHKVHHSATFLTPLTTARIHPLGNEFDALVGNAFVALPVGWAQYTFGIGATELAVIVAGANLIGSILDLAPLKHSHFPVSFGPFNKLIMSPHMHQLHHSTKREHWDKNMGNKLSCWDFMFGTGFIPVKGEPLLYGLGTIEDVRGDYSTLIGCYWGPFVKIYQMARRAIDGKSLTQADKDAMYHPGEFEPQKGLAPIAVRGETAAKPGGDLISA